MDVLNLVRLLWRHWLVVLLSSLVAALMLVAAVVTVPPTYRATSSVVLLNPPAVPDDVARSASDDELQSLDNPYERFNDLSVVVDIMRRILVSGPSGETLQSRGLVGTYTVAANIDFYRGPIVDVAAEAQTEADALKSVNLVVDLLAQTLNDVQERQGTDPQYFIRSDVVVAATNATRVLSSTLRRAIAVGALGAMLVIGSALLADAVSNRRRRSDRSDRSQERGSVVRDIPTAAGSTRRDAARAR